VGHARNPLTEVGITAYNEDGDAIGRRYTLRDYVQAEVPGEANERYVLSGDVWFRVADSWIKEVDEFVSGLADSSEQFDFPEWTSQIAEATREYSAMDLGENTPEGVYNWKLARDRGYELLDKRTVPIGGPNQKVEVCDLLTVDKELVCIKRATRSSALSHLFAQASVSASLIPEAKYQDHLMTAYRRLTADASYDGPAGWMFVYGIATDKQGSLPETLFFFSKVNLATHAKDIQSRGFSVSVAKIPIAG
jgi:uncharacterized protein (TIGR04141 family)